MTSGRPAFLDPIADWLRARRRLRASKRASGNRRLLLGLLASLVILLGCFAWSLAYLYSGNPSGQRIGLAELMRLTNQHRVSAVVFHDQDSVVTGTVVTAGDLPATDGRSFYAAVPANGQGFQTLVDALSKAKVDYVVDSQTNKKAVTAISTFLLPLMILADLFALLFSIGRGSGSAIGEVMTFGTIGKGKVGQAKAAIGFADVGGADEAVAELREVRDYLTDPAKYEALGAAPPKGVLLFGPPGTGKTLLAKAVAGEAGVPFFSVAGAEFVESLVGVGAARVRDLFARVRAAAPAIVFIDELDAAGRKRGSGSGGGGSDEREQTLNQLLVEMDGFEVSAGIVVMGATNRPDILDPALMRPGRFDRHITIERPELDGRLHILGIHCNGKPIADEVDLPLIARRTPGFTGADLANVVNEATLLAIRDQRVTVGMRDFEEAIQRVLSGPKRRGKVLSAEERHRTAVHEAGHAVVATAQGSAADIHRVSILARGRTVAATLVNPEAETTLFTRNQLRQQLVTLLAGQAAETLVLGEPSTGSEQDVEQATDLAREIVARYGMSEELGPIRLLGKASDGFLGNDIPFADMAPDTQSAIDEEMRRLLEDAHHDATRVLAQHRGALDLVAAKLVEEETLEGPALAELLHSLKPDRPTRTSTRVPATRSARPVPNGAVARR